MAHRSHAVPPPSQRVTTGAEPPVSCQARPADDAMAGWGRPVRAAAIGLRDKVGWILSRSFHAAIQPLLSGALHAHYRRVTAVGLERFPRVGPALVVANHPCTWTDALTLLVVLRRRLHFIVESPQFRPWPRALFLRLFGGLPVYFPGTSWDYDERNEETFRRCEALFDRGEVVVLFPEGISRTDRFLMPLKPGAARLALSYAARDRASTSFALVPVGLRFTERTTFRSDVGVSVGRPIGRTDLCAEASAAEGVRRLTARLARVLEELAVAGHDPAQGALLASLEGVARARIPAYGPAQGATLARSVASLERRDPRAYASLARHARTHARVLRAIRVSDGALAWSAGAGAPSSGWSVALLALPGAIGALIHALPASLATLASHRRGYGPSEIAFARIVSGLALLALEYAAAAVLFARGLGFSPGQVAAALAFMAVLGTASLALLDRVRPLREQIRLARVERRHGRLVERARMGRDLLGVFVDDLLTPSPWVAVRPMTRQFPTAAAP
jgi:glycerol-3-phosphate O-acyltransferase / dihydroxyacetone phosphate acyltransferase